MAITFIGIALASLGQYIIAILTHGKFTEAYGMQLYGCFFFIATYREAACGVVICYKSRSYKCLIMICAAIFGY